MEDLTDVYNELIMEHRMNWYNKKKLSCADFCEIGHNPNCGDEITLELKLNENGSVRLMVVTEKQYEAIEILVGELHETDTPFVCEQLSIFW